MIKRLLKKNSEQLVKKFEYYRVAIQQEMDWRQRQQQTLKPTLQELQKYKEKSLPSSSLSPSLPPSFPVSPSLPPSFPVSLPPTYVPIHHPNGMLTVSNQHGPHPLSQSDPIPPTSYYPTPQYRNYSHSATPTSESYNTISNDVYKGLEETFV